MQTITNFFQNPTVQNVAYKATQVVVTGVLAGVVNMLWSSINGPYKKGECTGHSPIKPFAIGFVLGAAFQTARVTNVFSQPVFANFATKVAENKVILAVCNFFKVVT